MINKDLVHSKDIIFGMRRLNSDVNKTQPITERNRRRLEKKKGKR